MRHRRRRAHSRADGNFKDEERNGGVGEGKGEGRVVGEPGDLNTSGESVAIGASAEDTGHSGGGGGGSPAGGEEVSEDDIPSVFPELGPEAHRLPRRDGRIEPDEKQPDP